MPIVAALSLLGRVNGTAEPLDDESMQKLGVPLEPKSQVVVAAMATLKDTLRALRPRRYQPVRVVSGPDKPYILYGDLFHNGHVYALVTMNVASLDDQKIDTGFAQWTSHGWEARGFWKVESDWLPKGAVPDPEVHYPITPAEKPFWAMDLNRKGDVGVVMVGQVWKYWQEHYLFRFDPAQNSLVPVEEAMRRPRLIQGWLRFYYNSGHRAIFEEWHFGRWNGRRFTKMISWHDETPYNDVDPHFTEVVLTDSGGKETKYRIVEGNSDSNKQLVYEVTKNDEPFARLTFNWIEPIGTEDGTSEVYIFKKLTGLPPLMFPDTQPFAATPKTHFRKVRVSGSHEALKMLSP